MAESLPDMEEALDSDIQRVASLPKDRLDITLRLADNSVDAQINASQPVDVAVSDALGVAQDTVAKVVLGAFELDLSDSLQVSASCTTVDA